MVSVEALIMTVIPDAQQKFWLHASIGLALTHAGWFLLCVPLLQIVGHDKAVRDLHLFLAPEQQGSEEAADPWDAVAVSTGFDRSLKVWTHLHGLSAAAKHSNDRP